MELTTVPTRINARLDANDRRAIATIAGAITTPHRRSANMTDAVKAALSIAAEVLETRNADPVAAARS